MEDRELIDRVYEATLPRIKDIRDAVSRRADEKLGAEIAEGKWPMLAGLPLSPPSPAMEAEMTRIVWSAPLTDMAVQFLWSILSKATDGEFVVDKASVAAAMKTIDVDELDRATGLREHVRPVLEKMAEAFIEVVYAHGTIDIEIDGQPIRLRPTSLVTRT